MPKVTVTLKDIESQEVKTRRGPANIYRIKASDGRSYSTFDHELAQQAAPFRGQSVILDYVESQNGDYTNYNLNGVKVAPEGSQGLGDPGIAVDTKAIEEFAPKTSSTDKDVSIARAVALKAAVELIASGSFIYDSAEVYELLEGFVRWLLTGAPTPFIAADELVPF